MGGGERGVRGEGHTVRVLSQGVCGGDELTGVRGVRGEGGGGGEREG